MRPLARDHHRATAPPERRADAATLRALRARIGAIEGRGSAPSSGDDPSAPPGLRRLLEAGPRAGSHEGGWLHELFAARPADLAAAMALLLGWLADDDRPVLWVTGKAADGLAYAPGLLGHGLDPGRLVLVRPRRARDLLWAMEEGLKSRALAAVVGEPGAAAPGFKESRRLALAAREHGCLCLLLLRDEAAMASAAWSRWRIAACRSGPALFVHEASGPARAEVRLLKHRGGLEPQTRTLEWQDAPHRFRVAAALADRPSPSRDDAAGGLAEAG